MRIAICAAIIKNGKILLVRKRRSWILPGGKPKKGESDIDCLIREVNEELPSAELRNLRYYGDFSGITPHKSDILRAKVYFADIKGRSGKPAAEIAAVKWIKNINRYNLSDITSKIVDSLKRDYYL